MSTPNCLVCKLISAMVPYIQSSITTAWISGKYKRNANPAFLDEALQANANLIDKVLSDLHVELHELAQVEIDKLGINPGSAQRGMLQ